MVVVAGAGTLARVEAVLLGGAAAQRLDGQTTQRLDGRRVAAASASVHGEGGRTPCRDWRGHRWRHDRCGGGDGHIVCLVRHHVTLGLEARRHDLWRRVGQHYDLWPRPLSPNTQIRLLEV